MPLSADITTMDTMMNTMMNTTMDAPVGTPNESKKADKAMDSFLQRLAPNNLEPLWSKMSAMVPPSPNPSAVPAMWKYQEMLAHLELAAKLVPTEQAERRVLMLVNPSMGE
jgi:gentisate 1,2-dioxygenase